MHDLKGDGMRDADALPGRVIVTRRSAAAEIAGAVRRRLGSSGPARRLSNAGRHFPSDGSRGRPSTLRTPRWPRPPTATRAIRTSRRRSPPTSSATWSAPASPGRYGSATATPRSRRTCRCTRSRGIRRGCRSRAHPARQARARPDVIDFHESIGIGALHRMRECAGAPADAPATAALDRAVARAGTTGSIAPFRIEGLWTTIREAREAAIVEIDAGLGVAPAAPRQRRPNPSRPGTRGARGRYGAAEPRPSRRSPATWIVEPPGRRQASIRDQAAWSDMAAMASQREGRRTVAGPEGRRIAGAPGRGRRPGGDLLPCGPGRVHRRRPGHPVRAVTGTPARIPARPDIYGDASCGTEPSFVRGPGGWAASRREPPSPTDMESEPALHVSQLL